MSVFHVNPRTLVTGPCGATKGKCPFGSENHYTSEVAAVSAVEAKLAVVSPLSKKRSNKQLVDSIVISDSVDDEMNTWLKNQTAWTKNERNVLSLLEESSWVIRKDVPEKRWRELASKISGLHFAKEMLSDKERQILAALEKIQKEWLK